MPDQLPVLFGNNRGLFTQELAQIGNPLAQLVASGVFHLSLLLLFVLLPCVFRWWKCSV